MVLEDLAPPWEITCPLKLSSEVLLQVRPFTENWGRVFSVVELVGVEFSLELKYAPSLSMFWQSLKAPFPILLYLFYFETPDPGFYCWSVIVLITEGFLLVLDIPFLEGKFTKVMWLVPVI